MTLHSDTAIFGCDAITLSFAGRVILNNISLSVRPGEILGLVGPNGAGKTSLFEVLTGRYKPESGRVFLGDKDISRLAVHDRARQGLARTYQSPIVPSSMTVGEAFRAARYSHKPMGNRHDAEYGARRARLAVTWDTSSGSLDTFNRRKLLMASLFMRKPKVLLLDEPASGLINSEIDELDLIIREQADIHDMGVILIEHRLELLSAIADRVVVLNLGDLIAEGAPGEVFSDPRVQAAYFSDEDAA